MKAIEVEIHNYKSICIDIKECKLRLDNAVTFLVGANESGKTNILEALTKYSRGGFEDIDIPYMCPYSGESEPPKDLRMVSVTYDIEDTDRKALGQIHKSLEKAKIAAEELHCASLRAVTFGLGDVIPSQELIEELGKISK